MTRLTYEQLDKANSLKERIRRLDDLLQWLNTFELTLDPPLRITGVHLSNSTLGGTKKDLKEGELYVIRCAFSEEKKRLEEEFAQFLKD